MPYLHKYWLKEFVKFFSIVQGIILVLFMFIEYLSRMDKFLEFDMTFLSGMGYVFLKIPFIFVQLTPAAILLATLIVFGIMNKTNELIVLRSSGINIHSLVKPALTAGLVLLSLMFFLGETVIPLTMAKANYIRHNIMKKVNISSSKRDIWIKSDRKIIHVDFYDYNRKSVSGVTVISLRENFSLESRIDSKEGFFKNGEWIFNNVLEQTYGEDLKDYDVKSYKMKKIILGIESDDLEEIVKRTNEMSFFELRDYAGKIQNEGYDATVYKVDMHGKIAFPFICIILVLTGTATGMRPFAGKNMPVAVAIGVVIAFMYWIMFSFCLSLGYGGVLPPFISAWITNLFFFCASFFYLVHTE